MTPAEEVPVGSVGGSRLARLDARGAVRLDRDRITLDWWIGADDRWHVANEEVAVRRSRRGAAPVYDTAVRVAGGDAVQRVYGIGGPSELVVVEVANESPAPFVQAFVLRGDLGRVSVDGVEVRVRGRTTLVLPKVPARWAVARRAGDALETVRSGGASDGPFPDCRRVGEVVFLHPVAHRTRLRAGVVLGDGAGTAVDMSLAPDADDAAKGWAAQLGRGMRVVLADEQAQQRVDAARADALLAGWSGTRDAALFNVLEDWGLDEEAARVWHALGIRERRLAAKRPPSDSLLRRTRDGLVRETGDAIELLPNGELTPVGTAIEVHDAPTRHGRVSFALRWHGERPALLWEFEGSGFVLRAPSLDPSWSTTEPRGETLLTAPRSVPRSFEV